MSEGHSRYFSVKITRDIVLCLPGMDFLMVAYLLQYGSSSALSSLLMWFKAQGS